MNKTNKNNPFRREGGGQIEKSKKESEWGKVKFNPVAKAAVTEQATPWAHFKNEIIQKQQNDKHGSRGNNTNSNTRNFLKKREENYRRNLIDSKRNEPTQWEDFSDETPATSKSKRDKATNQGQFQALPSRIKNLESISKNEFDSKLLTPQQNNFLKKVITKHTFRMKGSTFKQAVEDLKFRGVKRKKKSNSVAEF